MSKLFPPVLLLATLLLAQPVRAQSESLSHSTYLQQRGLVSETADLERWLRDELAVRRPQWSVAERHQNAAFFAFVLAVSGVTADALNEISASGVDAIHAITADTRPFSEQALLADLVVVGDVVRSETSTDSNDGYEISDIIEVRRVLKGEPSSSTIVLRRSEEPAERDVIPVVSEQYLLLLSRGMYEFAAARHEASSGTMSSTPPDSLYSVYRIYRMEDERLLWNDFDQESTLQAFEDIRGLDEMLRTSAQ